MKNAVQGSRRFEQTEEPANSNIRHEIIMSEKQEEKIIIKTSQQSLRDL